MKCGYCDKEITIEENHYCIEGRNFIVAENNKLRAERDELLAALEDEHSEVIGLLQEGRDDDIHVESNCKTCTLLNEYREARDV
jgi:hypothetical protein